jgi:hypothetical protein
MWDADTGAAYDALTARGVNSNEGTEATLALIGTVRALEIASCLPLAPEPIGGEHPE